MFVQTPFGLTDGGSGKLYVSDWDKKAILEVDLGTGSAAVREVISDVALPMSVHRATSGTEDSNSSPSSSSSLFCAVHVKASFTN